MKNHSETICDICGTRFMRTGPRQVYCSPECQERAYNIVYEQRRARDKAKSIRKKGEKLDQCLTRMAAAGYPPEDYGKYKTQQMLAEALPVNLGGLK